MRILVAPDKFKHSLGAKEVAAQIAAGLRDVLPDADITLQPIADGGEGTTEVICASAGGTEHECEVHDSLGKIVRASYCTIAEGTSAVMEMSQAAGLWRLAAEERDPTRADTFGVGEMLLDAAGREVEKIILGLGGSATNDGGFGMARALGFRFLDKESEELRAVGQLLHLARIEKPGGLELPSILAAVDVRNHLLGKNGATRTFAAQKGASPAQMDLLERALTQLADVVAQDFAVDFRNVDGAGAAGGLGFGLMSFCNAELRPGFKVVAEAVELERKIESADVVITGEGKLDVQTLAGKAPAGVAALANKFGKPVYAIVGRATAERGVREMFREIFELMTPSLNEKECMAQAPQLLRQAARKLGAKLRLPNE